MEALASPVVGLSRSQQSDIEKALGDFAERLASSSSSSEMSTEAESAHFKSYFTDPYALLDSLGMGYRNAPSYVTYETLRAVTERDVICAAILLTRLSQLDPFSRLQENEYSVGMKVRLRGRDKHRRLTHSEREQIHYIERFLLQTGVDDNLGRDGFVTFVKKFARDRLRYDQACFEKNRTRAGKPHSFACGDAATYRIAPLRDERGRPLSSNEAKKIVRYAQVIQGEVVNEYTHDQLAFCVFNPRSDIKVYGYGLPEPELLLTTVTAHLWAEEWNKRAFSQGSQIPGVLNLKGSISPDKWEAFKRDWQARMAGVVNSHKVALVNSDEVQFTPMQLSNNEMGYQMWMEYLVKVASAIYQIDPAEINFDLRGGVGQQPVFMSTNEAQQKMSKDRGLRPLLRFIEDSINRHVVHKINPEYELAFVGLDAQTEAQAIELRTKQASSIYTINELRAMENLPPVKGGDIIANPVYTANLQQQAMMQQGQGGMGGAPGGGGMPGMPPGAGGQQMPPQGFNRPAGPEEHKAAGELERFDRSKKSHGHSSDESSSADEVLHENDWNSSVHASLRGGDLVKSMREKKLYESFDLDEE